MTDPERSPGPPPASPGTRRLLNLLIVDDEPVIRRIAELALTGAGHLVAEAGDVEQAVAMIRSRTPPYDLILLDRTLPDGEGTTLIPLIRRESPGTKVLIVSGLGEADASGPGSDGFLAKPFTRATLLEAVERATGRGPSP